LIYGQRLNLFEYELIFSCEETMTERYAMAVRLKDEKRDFYIKNHANVWPEVLSELKKIKVKNYSIYLKEDFMFGYLEYDGNNFNKDMEEMQKIPVVDKWTKLMIDCFNPFPNNEDNNSWVMMDEIFYME
tara:strand:+ start:172 stop:561 length:390 start_codon:yes stop_codon:yes gene_type:complete